MPSNLLTDKTIRAGIKQAVAQGKPLTLSDGEGLTLIARPNEVGWWRFRYWIDGKENRLSLGKYPSVSLADARIKRDDARKMVSTKVDPSLKRKEDEALRLQDTIT